MELHKVLKSALETSVEEGNCKSVSDIEMYIFERLLSLYKDKEYTRVITESGEMLSDISGFTLAMNSKLKCQDILTLGKIRDYVSTFMALAQITHLEVGTNE